MIYLFTLSNVHSQDRATFRLPLLHESQFYVVSERGRHVPPQLPSNTYLCHDGVSICNNYLHVLLVIITPPPLDPVNIVSCEVGAPALQDCGMDLRLGMWRRQKSIIMRAFILLLVDSPTVGCQS